MVSDGASLESEVEYRAARNGVSACLTTAYENSFPCAGGPVLPGKRIGGGVLEGHGSSPIDLARMTDLAFRGETGGDMVGLLCALVIRKVTSTTIG